jgi:hypothetical protein
MQRDLARNGETVLAKAGDVVLINSTAAEATVITNPLAHHCALFVVMLCPYMHQTYVVQGRN